MRNTSNSRAITSGHVRFMACAVSANVSVIVLVKQMGLMDEFNGKLEALEHYVVP